MTHMKDTHPIERFKCDDCEYIGVSYQALTRHTYVIHQGRVFPCEQCEYKASTLKNVQIHTARVHCTEPPNSCEAPTCDYQSNRLALIDHMKRIHGPCKMCNYTPSSVMDKQMHKRTHRLLTKSSL